MKKTLVLLLVLAMIVIANVTPAALANEGVALSDGITLNNGDTIYRLNGDSYEEIGAYVNTGDFPLAGTVYEGFVDGEKVAAYDAIWESSGRLWQPNLPSKADRQTHTIAVELLAGYSYTFNGVESVLTIDWNCDGKPDEEIANREDGKEFSVPADKGILKDDVRVVWALVWSSTPSGGTEIIAVGPIAK